MSMRIELSRDQAAYLRTLQQQRTLAEAQLNAAVQAIVAGRDHRGRFAVELGEDPHIALLGEEGE